MGDQFAPTPEQIRDCVKALVSSLSQMVMDSVKGDLISSLRIYCTKLVNSTYQLIGYAKLTAEDEPSLMTAITNSIEETSTSVSKFIDAFVDFVKNRQDQNANITFSKASKDFADSIINMINIIDFTNISEVEKLCSVDWPNKEAIISSCKEFEFCSKILIYNVTIMLNLSTIEQRRVLLNDALDTMEENTVIFLDNARNFSKNPHDPLNVEFQKKALESSKNYCKGINKIIQAMNITEDSPFRNFFAALEYIQVLIVIAHKLFKSSSLFSKLVAQGKGWRDLESFVEVLEGYLNRTMDVCRGVMDKESDAAKRAFLESCIWEIEDVFPLFQSSVRSLKDSKADAKDRSADLNDRIVHATKKIITGVDDGTYSGNSKMKINLNAVALTSMDGIGLTSHLEVYNSEVFGNEQLDRDQIRGVEFHDNSPIKNDYGYDEYGGEEYY